MTPGSRGRGVGGSRAQLWISLRALDPLIP
jgi:hypothetical protein